ncbi:MAG: isoprenylcysteine carboxylmethyltransferase family protein [bacterium]|nr:isoprenylcysteine carboxylmethyltransferase family protein [bacterium]
MIFIDLFAIVFFILLAPIPLFFGLFQFHPNFFKRFGYWNYVVVLNIYILMTIATLKFLPIFIILRYSLPWFLVIVGGILTLAGICIAAVAGRHLSFATLIALPQIHPQHFPSKCITTGIYHFMRHPRYVGCWLIAFGLALATGFLALWELLFWTVIGFSTMAYLEEKELQKRFGKEYTEYMQRVPTFIPKIF